MMASWRVSKLLEERYSSCKESFITGNLYKKACKGGFFPKMFDVADTGINSRLSQVFSIDMWVS